MSNSFEKDPKSFQDSQDDSNKSDQEVVIAHTESQNEVNSNEGENDIPQSNSASLLLS